MSDFFRKIFSSKSDDAKKEQPAQKKLGRDDFVDLAPLGRGSFARVILVSAKENKDSLFALKVVEKQTILQQHRERDAFIERNIMRRVDNPFILRLHATFQSEHKLFFVLDYCQGGDFDKYLNALPNKSLPYENARLYAAEVLHAIKCLHDANIIYRDLKPENILMTKEGHLVLADFGLSKDFGEQQQGQGNQPNTANSFVGSPFYVSPDVLRQQKYTSIADMWSYGILLYRMLYGKTPFTGRTMKEVFDQILTAPVQFPSPGVENDAAARDLIVKLLERDPARRPNMQQIMQHAFWQKSDAWPALPLDEVLALKHKPKGWTVPPLPSGVTQSGSSGSPTGAQANSPQAAATAVTHTAAGAAQLSTNQQAQFKDFTAK